MATDQAKVEALFEAARSRAVDERVRYLTETCGPDTELRAAVESLLVAHDAAGDFLQAPPVDPDLDPPLMFTAPGTIIGRYKILESIGEGGYGTVFMAEQTTPVQRKVALKIIKAGMDTRQVIARFEAERQALALMDHPNIAKVFDAGVTDTGRPYFVMELVKGTPITKYCDEHKLTPKQRLELFIQVCQAVQHAHQKGIIHRDLKPTNVLVAQYDGKPVPKVIDFGVAKAAGQQLTERTMFTGFGDVIGTPQYMSPEQAELNQLDIDTRSDIYSLGVLLYELLTGSTPLEAKRVKEAALLEVLRVIREEEPPRPSTRLTTVAELPSIAAQRGLEPKSLSGIVKGELDWIVMRALEKDRSRRYETANGLAMDIQRYLSDETVHACPPSTTYRVKKFVRRNKGPAVAAAIVLLTLLSGIIGTSFGLIRAQQARRAEAARAESERRAREEAEAQRQRAEDNFFKARVAVRNLLTSPALGRGEWAQLPASTRKKFEEEAARYYTSLLQGQSPDPLLRYETGVGLRSLGFLYSRTDPRRADELLRQSVEILEPLYRDAPHRTEYRQQLGWSHLVWSSILAEAGRAAEAELARQRAMELYVTSEAERLEVVGWYSDLATMHLEGGRMTDAAELYRRAVKVGPENYVTWFDAAPVYLATGDLDGYRAACRQLLDRFEKLAEQRPEVAERIAKTCALAPESVPNFSRVERLAQHCVTGTEHHWYYRYFCLAKGLTEHRVGRHEQAIAWVKRMGPVADGASIDAGAFAVLAMAHHQLAQHDEARVCLQSSRAIITAKSHDISLGAPTEWVRCEILFREAAELLGVNKSK
jgi:serine/threonine protein kinase/tetratricopeptide (TPR) repeat protein